MIDPDITFQLHATTTGKVQAIIVSAPSGSAEAAFCESFPRSFEHKQATIELREAGIFFKIPTRSPQEIGIWISETDKKRVEEFLGRRLICQALKDTFMLVDEAHGQFLQQNHMGDA